MKTITNITNVLVILLFLFILSCSSKKNEEIEYVEREVDEIYNTAVDHMNNKKFISTFSSILSVGALPTTFSKLALLVTKSF